MVERSLRNKGSDIAYFHARGDHALDDVAGPDGIFLTDNERSDEDAWAPLAIDRDDPEYIEVTQSIDNALEKIRGDNGYASSAPEERSGILASIDDGLEWITTKMPTKAQIIAKVVEPLRFVAAKFSGAIIGEAAREAAIKIMKWLAGL